jgi:hypothetical protein
MIAGPQMAFSQPIFKHFPTRTIRKNNSENSEFLAGNREYAITFSGRRTMLAVSGCARKNGFVI